MATGPDHYRKAEDLVDLAQFGGDDIDLTERRNMIAGAQVHATLALAAATALGREGSDGTQPSMDRAAWFDVAAECRKATS